MPTARSSIQQASFVRSCQTISGQREKEPSEKDIQNVRIERPNGRFHRRFALPDTVDSNAVRATGRDGVLQIEIPKQPKAQPKRIQVAVDH
jgi:HSP20 family protein